MSQPTHRFQQANDVCRRQAYRQWQRRQSKQHILRFQVGFQEVPPRRPPTCAGCYHYHGLAYGTGTERQVLVCAVHPYGWAEAGPCPDWMS